MRINKYLVRLTALFVGAFIFQTAFCQENYLPGHLVDLKGDTLQGFVDYRNWNRNPDKIRFKEKETDPYLSFTPTQIAGFSVKDEVYISAVVDVEKSPVIFSDLEFDRELHIRSNDTTFLKTIIAGPRSLYHYKDFTGKDQFYIGKDSTFELLRYKKYLKRYKEKKIVQENYTYRSQLREYLSDCETIQDKLSDTYYEEKRLQKLFLSYYDCTYEGMNYQSKTEKIKAETGALIGVSLTKLVFSGEEYVYMANADYPVSANLAVGLFLDLILSKSQNKWSVYNELLYTSFNVEGQYDDIRSDDIYDLYFTEVAFSYIKMNNMLRFSHPVGNVSVFLNAGVSNGFATKENTYLRIESKVYGTERTTEKEAGDDPWRKHELGLVIGLGAKLKRISFEVRYEKGNGISNYVSTYTRKNYFLLGYRF